MSINIGYNFKNNEFINNLKTININELNILNQIAKDIGIENFELVNNSEDYTTLKYNDYDLIRLKYTDNAKWISIFLTKEDKSLNIDNILFAAQKNKNQLFWKSDINGDLSVYYSFIKNKYNELKQ